MKTLLLALVSMSLFATQPATTNYKLNSYGFGSGSTPGSSTSTYRIEGSTGELSGNRSTTATYKIKPGFIQTQQAHVPVAPTLTNPSNYYDKLKLVINQSGNPTDALYAISISADNFVADTRFVKSDHTVGATLAITDYQTYASWGGGSGFNIIGLNATTTYTVKVKATQGRFSESEYGPTAQASTVGQKLSFSVSPNAEALGNLLPGSVVTSPSNVTANIDSNANAGVNVYITGLNAGLLSPRTSSTIATATADLASASTGFGAQGVSATQSSGGPLSIVSPYNVVGQNVGLTDAVLRNIFHATNPITSGQGVFNIKAKSSSLTPASDDYAETLTVIGAAIF